MTRPVPTRVFHMTRIERLPGMVSQGVLSDAECHRRSIGGVSIAYPQVKSRREKRPVPCGATGTLADYVPWYFAPKSPMLRAISGGQVSAAAAQTDEIVYLVSSTQRLRSAGLIVVVSNRHAVLQHAQFSDADEALDGDDFVDWEVMAATMWTNTEEHPDRKERRQAECLAHPSVPWAALLGVAVRTEDAARRVEAVLQDCGGTTYVVSDRTGTSEEVFMPITVTSGNLLTQDVDALVNTVNTVGVMGKGIALQFKRAWPEMFTAYAGACERGEVQPGRMHVWETGALTGPRFIVNFPTKRHWKDPSRLEDVRSGLSDLVRLIGDLAITSIAVPPLGCGNGGLAWADVEPLITEALAPVAAEVDVRVFAPAGAPPAAEQVHREPAPRLTPGRAALLALMSIYQQLTFEPATLVEVQKLAYFLQNAGEPLGLRFSEGRYGPYADDLRKSLRAMEGHFTSGFGDGSARVGEAEPIQVLPSAESQVRAFLAEHPDSSRRIDEALRAIEGFESTYGLELLATVHWVLQHDEVAATSWDDTHAKVRAWSPRKASLFTPPHVETAWRAVTDRHLVTAG